MRIIRYLLQKEFLQIMRNRTMLPIIFIVPIVQLLILVYAANLEMKTIRMGIIDKDASSTSIELVSKFKDPIEAGENFEDKLHREEWQRQERLRK